VKTLYILDSLNRGGTETLVLDVCRNARANGLDLVFVATGGGDLEQDFQTSGTPFIRLQRRLPIDVRLIKELRQIIEEHNIQLVHSHQAVEALHAYYATLGKKVKHVMSFHLCECDRKNYFALKFLIPRMDANIAVSHDLSNCLEKRWKAKFDVLYNGVDPNRLQSTRDISLRKKLGLSDDDLLLGMVGNFYQDERKDQLTVCKALSLVFNRIPNAQFVFVGGCSEGETKFYNDCVSYCYEHGLQKRVRFLGKRSDIPNVLSSLDIFVFSSLKDSFGIAVVEAMMMGVPTIVSNIDSLLEVTNNGLYASVFRKKHPEDLAQKMLDLINNVERRAKLSVEAKHWALQQFSIETYTSNAIELYEQV
jgi:L-malate glycosyltransferase